MWIPLVVPSLSKLTEQGIAPTALRSQRSSRAAFFELESVLKTAPFKSSVA